MFNFSEKTKNACLLIFMVSFLLIGQLCGQNYELATTTTTNKGFDVNSGDSLGITVNLLGVDYPLFTTVSGSQYIKLPSSKGGFYPFWVINQTDEKFLGETIYSTTKGSKAILKLSNRGLPVPIWLGADSGQTFTDASGNEHNVRLSSKGRPYYLYNDGAKIVKVNLQAK
jgi:hypothetical protein